MRVSIEPFEQSSLLGTKYGVRCEITFTEEEKSIMSSRNVAHRNALSLDRLIVLEKSDAQRRYALATAVSLGVWALSMLLMLAFDQNPLPVFLFMASTGAAAYFVIKWNSKKTTHVTGISLADALVSGKFTVPTANASESKAVADTIEAQLRRTKAFLLDNVEIGERRTVEI